MLLATEKHFFVHRFIVNSAACGLNILQFVPVYKTKAVVNFNADNIPNSVYPRTSAWCWENGVMTLPYASVVIDVGNPLAEPTSVMLVLSIAFPLRSVIWVLYNPLYFSNLALTELVS